jgi:hypothetical protein
VRSPSAGNLNPCGIAAEVSLLDTHQRVLHLSQPLQQVDVLIADHLKLIAQSSQLIAQSTPKENS